MDENWRYDLEGSQSKGYGNKRYFEDELLEGHKKQRPDREFQSGGALHSSPAKKFEDQVEESPPLGDPTAVQQSLLNYDGYSDPAEHIYQFNKKMEEARVNKPVRCKQFAATLIGGGRTWFSRLPPELTKSWISHVDHFD
ncbi:hypothetical protein POM88_035881 [Heracleum sosnowskyi]|uniref:Uncharacterized protein n=1 Tax=Heracleum sosnowskyi TaxID=360622 RepID=A0AAD8HMA5_9APIA|nr:hypothetical protein POM88_035881 [Heracleum sosnowskyi]